MVEAMGIEPMSATHQTQSATCLVIAYTAMTLSITKKCHRACSVIVTPHNKKVLRNILSGLYVFNRLVDTPIKQELLKKSC